MARQGGTKSKLIKCEYCGEMYAASYKHCPFCNEDGTGRWGDPDAGADEYYDDVPQRGRHLAGGSGPSAGRIIGWVLSLALIIAAAGIVFSIVRSMVGGKEPPVAESQPPVESQSAAPSQPVESVPVESAPVESAPVAASTPPAPQVSTPSVDLVTPTAFTLNREDFTFSAPGEVFQMVVTYTPANANGSVTWKSSNPNVAAVSWNGLVTAVSKGTVTLTATVEGVGEKTCIVRCNFKDGAGSSASGTTMTTVTAAPAASSAPSSSLKLNREDFTLSREGETWRLTVSGTSSAVVWSTSDANVATVSGDGTVTAVSKGTCRVTATVDGQTLKCIVRCNF